MDIARELAAKPDDIIFTSGATEANNLAIQGAIGEGTSHVLYLPSAHASTVETLKAMEEAGIEIEPLTIKEGKIDIESLKRQVRPETVLVSTDFVCGETGTLWNTREVRHALDGARAPGEKRILLHVDASQAPFEESLERTRLGADLITLDAQKVGGMRGVGVLVAPRTAALSPVIYGGGQERGLRPGTPAHALAAAFACSLVEAREGRETFAKDARKMREALIEETRDIHGVHVNQGKEGMAHILNISLLARDTDYLAALLDADGFAVSTKSACESDSEAGSRAVIALTGNE
jgi:cysteine desulfurase